MKEEWKAIAGFENRYEVSNYGRVKSLKNTIGSITLHEKILKPTTSKKDGYVRIGLHKNNKSYTRTVHKLVAMAFIDNPKRLSEINHKDGNKQNNNVSNLEWCTSKENHKHAIETGLRIRNNASTSLAVDMFTIDGEYVTTFPSMAEASRQTGINITNISRCCRNAKIAKTAGGYIWRKHNDLNAVEKEKKEKLISEIIQELYLTDELYLLDAILGSLKRKRVHL